MCTPLLMSHVSTKGDVMSFEALSLKKPLLKAILEKGYESPSPIQEAAIPLLIQVKHVVFWTFQFILMMIIGLMLYTFLEESYIAVASYIFFTISRESSYPLLDTMIVRATPSKVKATVLSSFGQLDAIGQLISGAMMVFVMSLVGLQGMYVFTAGLLLVPLILTTRVKGIDHIK